jgi:hypothetical protein
MPDSKISNLTALAEAPASDDLFVVVDKSDTTQSASGTTKRITRENLLSDIDKVVKPASASAPASLDLHEDIDNGTNKITITAPSAIASDKTLTLPDETGTVATQASANSYADKYQYEGISRQAIINGGFTVNQRAYVSNAVLASGAYGHDRWKAGASGGDYTFTQLASATQITIKSGKSLIQVVENKNVVGGSYTLSWEGTAQARFGKDSATPSGAYAVSPITITGQTAGTVMSVEFNEGTLGKVNLNVSSVALPFQPKSFEEELMACQRYYEVVNGTHYGFGTNACFISVDFSYKVTKRTAVTPAYTEGTLSGCAFNANVANGVDNAVRAYNGTSGSAIAMSVVGAIAKCEAEL